MAAPGSKYNKRADGNYQHAITIGRKDDGRPIRKLLYAKTIKELDEKIREFENERQKGVLPLSKDITFAELSETWVNEYKPQISTAMRKKYRTLLDKHLLPPLGPLKIRDLKPMHLQTIINAMAAREPEPYATGTMKEVKGTASQILEVAYDNDMIYKNVFAKIAVPRIEPEERRPLTKAEQKLVWENIDGHRMGLCACVMMYCGLRRGEALALQWGDIDLGKKLIKVRKSLAFDGNHSDTKAPKTKAGNRDVPIPEQLLPHLHAAKKKSKSLIVFPNAGGAGYMTQIAFKRAWESYLSFLNLKAGGRVASRSRPKIQTIDNLTPHMFRHTYATLLYEAGVDVKSAQKFMGHADIQMTLRIYTHLTKETEGAAIDSLNAFLSQSTVVPVKGAVKVVEMGKRSD